MEKYRCVVICTNKCFVDFSFYQVDLEKRFQSLVSYAVVTVFELKLYRNLEDEIVMSKKRPVFCDIFYNLL